MNRRTFLKSAGTAGIIATAGGAGWSLGQNDSRRDIRRRVAAASSAGLNNGQALPLGNFRTIYSVAVDEPVVGLSFDDGPDPRFTPRILEILADYGVSATFFIMGHNAVTHRSLLAEVVDAGHEPANHTFNHYDLSALTVDEARDEIRRAHNVIEDLTGQPITKFRPPRGRVNGASLKTIASLHCDLMMWSITGSVRGRTTPDVVNEFVLSSLEPGAIIGYHDGVGRGTFAPDEAWTQELVDRRNAEIDGLPEVLERAMADGYRFLPLGELLEHEVAGVPSPAAPNDVEDADELDELLDEHLDEVDQQIESELQFDPTLDPPSELREQAAASD